MSALWDGYDFPDQELEFWAQEICAAALELPEAERRAFIGHACEGSERLRHRTEMLLAEAWDHQPVTTFSGVCRPGEVVGDCIILSPVGRGGMSEVYKAIQRPLRRLVAVKVASAGSDAFTAVAREAENSGRLLHPNIATVYDADVQSDKPCIVMEYVEGISLREWLDRYWHTHEGSPAGEVIRSIVRQVALALGEAHRRGIVHRDVKPENILLAKRGTEYTVKVVDFGVARRLNTPGGPTIGTPGYVAPEQLSALSSDRRADVFALGAVLYELLTGKQPFAGRSDAETYFRTLSAEPEFPSDAPRAALSAIARRALHKAPADRYQTTDTLIADLEHAQTERRHIGLNPLVSELPVVLQRWWERRSAGSAVAFLSFFWGCASLALSVASGAACVRVLWATPGVRGGYEMIYGYAVEPNAALWYMFGASVCFLTGFAFLEAAHRGLARTPVLAAADTHASNPDGPLATIAERNRQYFQYATPVIGLLAVCFVAIPELAFRDDHAFGWVQADLAGRYISSTYDDLRRAGKIGEVPSLTGTGHPAQSRVAAIHNRSNGFQAPAPVAFSMFLLSALVHQIVLTGFLWWIVAKILFLFWMLSTALLGGTTHGLRLVPDFQDKDDYRFGLGRLDNVYYAILALIAVGSLGLFVQVAANVSKGTYFFAGDPAPALLGQAVLLLGTVGLLAILLVTPASVFLLLTVRAVGEELGRLSGVRKNLEAQLATARSSEERDQLRFELDRLRERRETTKRQSLLPIRRPAFLALVAASLLMLLVVPLSIRWFGGTSTFEGSRTLSGAVCAACGNSPIQSR
jgi:hypothetical protein